MSTIKNVILGAFATLITGLLSVIGMLAGFAIWDNGLGETVAEKTKQLFKKES